MSRHLARETAFKMLFQIDVGKNEPFGPDRTLALSGLQGEYKNFAQQLAAGVTENLYDLNQYLSKLIQLWELERLAAVDRNIIRLGMYELKFIGTPVQVTINEAVELAKKYGAQESPAFVNAVLDGFYHKVIVEDRADFHIDENMKAKYFADLAKAEQMAVDLEAEAEPVVEVTAAKPTKTVENKQIKSQGYRIIKSDAITEDDKIKAESILADKQRMYGEAAYLTNRDLRRALENGEDIPEEALLNRHEYEAANPAFAESKRGNKK